MQTAQELLILGLKKKLGREPTPEEQRKVLRVFPHKKTIVTKTYIKQTTSGSATPIQIKTEGSQPSPQIQQRGTPPPNILQEFLTHRLPFNRIVGQDVAGYPVTSLEIYQESKKAPSPIKSDKTRRDWAEKKITTKGIESGNIPILESYSVFGYRPYIPEYATAQSNVSDITTQEKTILGQLLTFKKDFPSWKKIYLSNKQLYEQGRKKIEAGQPTDIFWIDINKNMVEEEGEYFTQQEALKVHEQSWIIQEEGTYKGKFYDEWYADVSKSYKTVDKDIASIRENLVSQASLKNILTGYQMAGYEISKTKEGGYIFNQPSAKKVSEYYYGAGSTPRAIAVGEMEAFPIFIPISAIVAAIGSPFTGGKSWSDYEEGIYQKSLNLTARKEEMGVNVGSYAWRFWNPFSESGVGMNIYLPLVLMGTSYLTSGLSQGGMIVGKGALTQFITKAGTKTSGKLLNLVLKSTLTGVGIVGMTTTGISLGITAARHPEDSWRTVGQTAQSWGQAMGGWALGGYMYAQHVPKPKIDITTGLTKSKVNIRQFTVQGEPTDFGEVRFDRTQFVETIIEGEKPGTSITYKSSVQVKGRGIPIDENIYAVRSEGFSFKVKSPTNIWAEDFTLKMAGKLFKAGKISVVESYGLSSLVTSSDTGSLYVEKGVSGLYSFKGKPDVFTSKGLSFVEKSNRFSKIFDFGEAKLAQDFEVSKEFSGGIYKSRIGAGIYKAYGKTFVPISEKPNVFTKFIESGVSPTSDFSYKYDWGSVKYESSGDLKGLNKVFKRVSDIKGFTSSEDAGMGVTGRTGATGGGVVTKTIVRNILDLSSVNAQAINIGLSSAKTSPAIVKFVSSPISIVSSVKEVTKTSREYNINKFIPVFNVLKENQNISKLITGSRLSFDIESKHMPVSISVGGLDVLNKSKKKTVPVTALKVENLLEKRMAIQVLSTFTVPVNTTVPVLPVMPLVLGGGGMGGGGGGWGLDADWQHRKRKHGVKLLFKELVIPKIYLKNW